MKFFLGLLITAAFCLLSLVGLPWWLVVIAGFVSALVFRQSFIATFLAAFFGGGLTWMITAYLIDSKNQGLLSEKIAELMSVGQGLNLILIAGLIGALGAGIGAIVGYELSRILKKDTSAPSNA